MGPKKKKEVVRGVTGRWGERRQCHRSQKVNCLQKRRSEPKDVTPDDVSSLPGAYADK